MPGPGSYDPSGAYDFIRQRSTAARIMPPSSSSAGGATRRKVKRPAASELGPGSYDTDLPQRAKNALIPPKPTTARRKAVDEDPGLGPGQYDANFAVVEPKVMGGAMGRAKADDSDSVDLTTLRRRLKAKSGEKQLALARSELTDELEREISLLASKIAQRRDPGPARYNPSVTPTRKRRTHGLIVPGDRWAVSASVSDRLGPGCYDPEGNMTERSLQFERARRDIMRKAHIRSSRLVS